MSVKIERNVAAVSVALLLVTLGENLWLRFVPKYLQALGAPVMIIGLYGSLRDLLDGLYQYPGGWVGDRLGRRRTLTLFIAVAICGYLVYLVAGSWMHVLFGLALVMAWASMASPTIFAVVGDALPRGQRAIGFTVQAIVKRIPMTIAPLIGGYVIAKSGIVTGTRLLLVVTIVVAVAALAAVQRIQLPRLRDERKANVGMVWRTFPHSLRMLLVADVFARTCEGLMEVFVVVWATSIAGVSAAQFGVLVAIQSLTSMLVYLPAARFADQGGRKPVVIATFIAFAAYPIAVVLSKSFVPLVIAFIVGGLREVGEPSRKSMIVDFADPAYRARSVGLYYLIRSLTIAPAAAIGGVLWTIAPPMPFYAACAAGILGAIVFAALVRE